jgi:hypothetical protein
MFRDERVADLLRRVTQLERKDREANSPTYSVPVVDEDGEPIMAWCSPGWGSYKLGKIKKLTFTEVCKALEDMCGVEITYQEVEGTAKVVVYERDE